MNAPSGNNTLNLYFNFFPQVTIFGFGADSGGSWSHYFEILKNKKFKTGAHPGEEEYKMIEKLHKKKTIVFFKGW